MDMIVPDEQGCPEVGGKALGRPKQASADFGLPSAGRDASQAEQRTDHDWPESHGMGNL